MTYSNGQEHNLSPERLTNKDKSDDLSENKAQVSDFIGEGNPNVQEEPLTPKNIEDSNSSQNISRDHLSAQVVKQAIKDDQGLSDVAHDIRVTVKDGVVTLDGTVLTEQEMNLATNTAAALSAVDAVNNQELSLKKAPNE